MREFTFGELKQGLICCVVNRNCAGCPLYLGDDLGPVTAGDLTCTGMLMSAAFNCINAMEKDLAEAISRADRWEAVATKHEQDLIELHEQADRRGEK